MLHLSGHNTKKEEFWHKFHLIFFNIKFDTTEI